MDIVVKRSALQVLWNTCSFGVSEGQVKYRKDFELLTTLLLCVVYYDSCLCVSHESKAKVRVFTTAFQESRRAALSLDLLRSIVLRPSNFSL